MITMQLRDDITLLMNRIREVDLSTSDVDTLQAIGGLLMMFLYWHPAAPSLLSAVQETALAHFKEASTMEEQSRWLRALLHINGDDRDSLFADVLDDDEFELLESRREDIDRWWESSSSHFQEVAHSPVSGWQLTEQQWQSRMDAFYHIDHSLLSGLSQANPEACAAFRRHCHDRMVAPDPEVDFSLQSHNAYRRFVDDGIKRLVSWLDAQEKSSTPMDAMHEVDIWHTIDVAMQSTCVRPSLQERMEERFSVLLSGMPAGCKSQYSFTTS